jgi:ATP-binding cassette subfamily F protein uup
MQNVVRSFGLRTVLDGVSLSLAAGERVGIVGRNGSGKTTLGRIAAGADQADDGIVTRERGATLGYLPQVPQLPPEQSAREIVLGGMRAWTEARASHAEASAAIEAGDLAALGLQAAAAAEIEQLGGWDREHEADAVLGHVGITDPNALAGRLSGGEARRVALARVLVARPTVAVLDEPTNHLDVETIEWLEEHLVQTFPGALLLVTHDRYLLDAVVSRTIELEVGKLHAYDGGFEAYLEARAVRVDHAQRAEANRQNYLRRELQWLRRQPKARTTKSRARVQRIEDALHTDAPTRSKTAAIEAITVRTGRTILEADGLGLDIAGRTLVDGLDLRLSKGDRLGIVGPNGIGKTTLLRALLGEREPDRGVVRQGKNTRVAYLDQMRSGLDPDATVYAAVAGGRSHVEVGGSTIEMRAWLERFLFTGATQQQKVGTISGGERARVALARLLAEPANLLVLDEPTNDLDVDTLSALEEMLLEYAGTCLVVTHDRWFLDRVATAMLVFEGDGRVVRHEGGWGAYRERRRAPVAEKPASKPRETPIAAPSTRLTYAERLELDALEPTIEAAEAKVARIEARLSDPATYEAGTDLGRTLTDDLPKARAEVERLMARWEELESKRE